MSTLTRLVLDRRSLISLVGDRRFYAACPGFAAVKPGILAIVTAYNASKKKRCCGGDWEALRPAVDAWVGSLMSQYADDERSVEPVRNYLATIKGFIPRPVVIYYRASSSTRPVRFEF